MKSNSQLSQIPKLKGENISDVATSLKDLHDTLSKIDQNDFERHREYLTNVAKKLIESDFLRHSDKTVKLLVACCLTDILRLFAPDAPYDQIQLRSIFVLIIQQLKLLSDRKHVYYNYVVYLVESLATVKSIVLLLDVDDGGGEERDKLLLQVFNLVFDLAPVPAITDTVKLYLCEILQILIDECDVVFPELVTCLLARSQDHRSATKAIAKQVICACADKLQGPLGIYLNEHVLQYIADAQNKSRALDNLRQVHEQILEIGKTSPSAISSAINQMEDELQADDYELRSLVVSALPLLFCSPGNDSTRQFPNVWNFWLNKMNDRNPQVRLLWVKVACTSMVRASVDISHQLQVSLVEKLQDIDAKVRERALTSLYSVFEASKSPVYIIPELCEEIAARCRDKVEDVRMSAIKLLCFLVRWLFSNLEGQRPIYEICANGAFNLLLVTDRDLRLFYEYYIEHSLLIPSEKVTAKEHALFLICIYDCLRDEPRKALLKWLHNKSLFVRYFEAYLQLFVKNRTDNRLNAVIQFLSSLFRAPLDAQVCLKAMMESVLPKQEFFDNFRNLVTPTCPLFKLRKTVKDLEGYDFTGSDARIKHYVMTFLVRRASLQSINAELISAMLESTREKPDLHSSIQRLVGEIIAEFPNLGIRHSHVLEQLIVRDDLTEVDQLEALQTYSTLVKSAGDNVKPSAMTIATVWDLLEKGSRKQVKYGTRILQNLVDQEAHLLEMAETHMLQMVNESVLTENVRWWQVLVEVARKISFVGRVRFDDAFNCVKRHVEAVSRIARNENPALLNIDCFTTAEITASLGIKFLRNFLTSLRVVDRAEEINHLKTFAPTLVDWLSLVESSVIMKLTIMKTLVLLVPRPSAITLSENMQTLVLEWMNSRSLSLSERMTSFVIREYHMGEIGLAYLALSILVNEQRLNTLQATFTSVKNNDRFIQGHELPYEINSRSLHLYEPWFIMTLILAASIPQSTTIDEDTLHCYTELANFLVGLVADARNISWLFEATVQLKRMIFVENLQSRNRHLYILSEIAQNALRGRATQYRWTLESTKQPILITDDILQNISSLEEANSNVQKSYLDHYRKKLLPVKIPRTGSKPPSRLDSIVDEDEHDTDKENRVILRDVPAELSAKMSHLRRSERNKPKL